MKSVVQFGLVGGLGFIFDASALSLFVSVLGMNIYVGRLLSFVLAVIFTWMLNRRFAFKGRRSASDSNLGEYLRYLGVQSAGALISLAVFFCAVAGFPDLRSMPVLPLAMGSAVAMAFNYLASRYFVYSTVDDLAKPHGDAVH